MIEKVDCEKSRHRRYRTSAAPPLRVSVQVTDVGSIGAAQCTCADVYYFFHDLLIFHDTGT